MIFHQSVPAMQDYRVTVKVRNNLFLMAMESCPYKTVRALSVASRVSIGVIYDYINLTRSPINETTGGFKDTVYLLCDTFGVLPDEIFTPDQYEAVKTNKAEFVAGAQDIQRLMHVRTPDELLEEKDRHALLWGAIETLSLREREVLELRNVSEFSLDKCAERMGVSRERIRQIEVNALRKLRDPKRLKYDEVCA